MYAELYKLLGSLEIGLCVAGLVAISAKKQWRDYWALGLFLGVRALSNSILLSLTLLSRRLIEPHIAYHIYFYVDWIEIVVEAILALVVIYSVFRLAMAPLKGLQTLGMLVFRWAAAISIAVALGSAFGPKITTHKYLIDALANLQRTQSILTLCLLLFVCFAIRPMGLTYSSRIFGVSLGMGMMATSTLVQSAWLAHYTTLSSGFSTVAGLVSCLYLATWTAYFALPESRRRIIVLPTTSPFLRWNQISLALGDNPGFVAVGGVPPELFAPAELEVMRRASLKMVTPYNKTSIGA